MRSRMIFAKIAEYEFLSACDGKEGVEVAVEKKPDLILMDVEMPRMSGFEACRALRENAATRRTPIVLLTSRGEAASVQTGLDSGCSEYLLKPVNEEQLVSVLKKYLQ